MIDNLTDENFHIYAVKSYNSKNCIMSEFESDLKRIKYIKRLVKKYNKTKDLKERLILNHIIILSNVFGTEACVRMLFFKLDQEDYSILKSFLLFLNYMPRQVSGIRGKDILSADISIDLQVTRRLAEI